MMAAGPKEKRFWIFGGQGSSSSLSLKDAWVYNATDKKWTQKTDMPVEIIDSAGTEFNFRRRETNGAAASGFLLFGGSIDGAAANRSWSLDLAAPLVPMEPSFLLPFLGLLWFGFSRPRLTTTSEKWPDH